MGELYQAKEVIWRRLDGTIENFGPCSVIVEISGMAKVNVLGNPVAGGGHDGASADKVDFLTHIDRLDIRVS